jgi:hypothetical protein
MAINSSAFRRRSPADQPVAGCKFIDRQVVHDLPKSGFAQPLQNVLNVGRIGPIPP